MSHLERWPWGALAAIVMLWLLVSAKVSSLRFRRRAVEVTGKVLKIFPHHRHTAYFIEYEYQGVTRVAEYAGLPLIREFRPGEHVQICIDGSSPPDVPVPDGRLHNQPHPNSTCELQGKPLVSIGDVLMAGGCIYLIASECSPWLYRILAAQ